MRAIDGAECEAMLHIATWSLLRVQVVVVLGRCRFKHWGAEIRCILERLGICIVRQVAQSIGKAPTNIHVARVIPALGCVFEQVDGADGKGGACNRDIGRKDGIWNEADLWMRPTRLNQSRSRLRVVDEVRSLQVNAARAEIAKFHRGISRYQLFKRCAPLLNVLRGRVQLKRCKTHDGCSEYRLGREVDPERGAARDIWI